MGLDKIIITPRDERRGYKCYVCGETGLPVVLEAARTTAHGAASITRVCFQCGLAIGVAAQKATENKV